MNSGLSPYVTRSVGVLRPDLPSRRAGFGGKAAGASGRGVTAPVCVDVTKGCHGCPWPFPVVHGAVWQNSEGAEGSQERSGNIESRTPNAECRTLNHEWRMESKKKTALRRNYVPRAGAREKSGGRGSRQSAGGSEERRAGSGRRRESSIFNTEWSMLNDAAPGAEANVECRTLNH